MMGNEEKGRLTPPDVRFMVKVESLFEEAQHFEVEFSQPVISIGRDPANDLRVPLPSASRFHARVFFEFGDFFLEDLGSVHGTEHNQRRLVSNECRRLTSGDTVQILGFHMTFSVIADARFVRRPGDSTEHLVRSMAQQLLVYVDVLPVEQLPTLRVMNGAPKGLRYILSAGVSSMTVGRSLTCDLTLADDNISRRHCVIRREAYGFTVRDLGSRNGVKVNGKLLSEECRLHDGDELALGPIRLSFLDPPSRLLKRFEGTPNPIEGEEANVREINEVSSTAASSVAGDEANEVDIQVGMSKSDQELINEATHLSRLEMVIVAAGAAALLPAIMFILLILI